ncbi:MAG: peptidase family protein [Thermoleophilia bacterium]|jgi:Zn-dependent metalloprotease|nr:peptidase family protein [Thermoleophilia bacterium]
MSSVPSIGRAGAPNARGPSLAAVPVAASKPAVRAERVHVWDMSSGVEQPVSGAALLRSSDPVVTEAWKNAQRVDEFLTKLGRNGLDGAGAPLNVVVHAPTADGRPAMNNAHWDDATQRVYLGDGDGKLFAPLGGSLDVLVHEATHAIVDSEVRLRYFGQQGGVNESWADVIGSLADPDDWLIGEDVYTPNVPGDALRDMAKPAYAHVRELPTGIELEPHDYSGIPSLAAVRVADQLGRDEMGRIWYSALVDHMNSQAGYAGAARATLEAASSVHGRDSAAVKTVLDAWKSVGVDPRWKASATA